MCKQRTKCLICAASISECRLGINCCRACAVFYKRIRSSKRAPTECVAGEGKCAEKGAIVSCRKCRFDMFEDVLRNAESKEKHSELTAHPIVPIDRMRLKEIRKTQFIDHTTFSLGQTFCSSTTILDKIRWTFSLMCRTRRTGEIGTTLQPFHVAQWDNIIFSPTTPSMYVANERIFKYALYDFAEMTFPEFGHLEAESKKLCIDSCIRLVVLVESTYRANYHFPDDLKTHFAGYTTIVTKESLVDDNDKNNLEEFNVFKANFTLMSRIREFYTRVQPDDVEFTALLGLAFWNNGVSLLNEKLLVIARKHRAEILGELQSVYKDRGDSEFAPRFGLLLCLLDTMENALINSEWKFGPPSAQDRILQRISREFKASVERRRQKEKVFLELCKDTMIVPHPTQKLYLANEKTPTEMFKISFAETRIFFREVFPALANLNRKDQDLLFNGYINKFGITEMYYRTRQVWGELNQFLMGSVLTVVNVENIDQLFGDGEGGIYRKLLQESSRTYLTAQFAIIVPVFKKAQITCQEFHALLALALCEIDAPCDVPEHVLSVVDDIRSEVFEDLQRYYKEVLCLDDYSTRLGNLMTLNHCIRECQSLFLEYFRMHTIVFDQYQTEEMIKDLFI